MNRREESLMCKNVSWFIMVFRNTISEIVLIITFLVPDAPQSNAV